jgi:hypothetical protein
VEAIAIDKDKDDPEVVGKNRIGETPAKSLLDGCSSFLKSKKSVIKACQSVCAIRNLGD